MNLLDRILFNFFWERGTPADICSFIKVIWKILSINKSFSIIALQHHVVHVLISGGFYRSNTNWKNQIASWRKYLGFKFLQEQVGKKDLPHGLKLCWRKSCVKTYSRKNIFVPKQKSPFWKLILPLFSDPISLPYVYLQRV